MGLLYGGGMRTLRQIFHGCKKHHYVYLRDIKWFEEAHYKHGFKTKLKCTKCMYVANSKIDMMIFRSTLDEIAYGKLKAFKSERQEQNEPFGYQPKEHPHIWVIGKPPVKP